MMGVALRVMIVEDSEDDTALLLRELQRGGYDVSYERVDSLAAMNSALSKQEWDIVISDHSIPHFSGTNALNLLRTKGSEVPFIFVSGSMGEEAAVAALKQGAQDYVMKSNLRSEEHTSELQSRSDLVCRLLLEKKKKSNNNRLNVHTIQRHYHDWT